MHYATTKEELIKYLQSVYAVLEPGGAFFGLNDNPLDDPDWHGKGAMKSIGIEKEMAKSGERRDGTEIYYSFFDHQNKKLMQISNYYFTASTYKEAFETVGFEEFRWIGIEAVDYSSEREELRKPWIYI